ncbi:MAG: hypothetical protein ACI841_002041 [Planctomycetota bacterium]|jgi:hypothetical protein
MKFKGTGTLTRLGIAMQVILTTMLALVALLLVNWLVGRPGFRQRFDLTSSQTNTLSTASQGVLSRLDEVVNLDIFYRPVPGTTSAVLSRIHDRLSHTLVLLSHASSNIIVNYVDFTNQASLDARRRDLKLTGFENCVVVSKGERREVLYYTGEIAEIDLGRPTPQGFTPPKLITFRAESAIMQGILGVLKGSVPKVYFTRGHGELDLEDTQNGENVGKLRTLLTDDGFETDWWQFDIDGPVPSDCSALAILAPDSPFAEEEREAVETYLQGGGRLLVGAHNDPTGVFRSGLSEWMGEHGIEISNSIACRVQFREGRPVVGVQSNAALTIQPAWMDQHPITTPLREGSRVLRFLFSHRVRVTAQPKAGVNRPLLDSGPNSWLDVSRDGELNFQHDSESEEVGPHDLAVTSQYRPDPTAGPAPALEQETETRIAVIGSASPLCNTLIDYNSDFARNLFNWCVDREYRVSISPRNPDHRRLPVRRTNVLAQLKHVTLWGLPGGCFLLGLLTYYLRNRGSKQRRLA